MTNTPTTTPAALSESEKMLLRLQCRCNIGSPSDHDTMDAAYEFIAKITSDNARMREALEPINRYYKPMVENGEHFTDESIVSAERYEDGVRIALTLGDLRRAASAMGK